MKNKFASEIENILKNEKENKTFETPNEFYEYLKTQGITASFEDVKAVLIDLNKQTNKEELEFEDLDEVAGGARIEVKNVVKNNKKAVKVGAVIVFGM